MWNIYGKKYDLTNFTQNHPGGSEILIKSKDLDDCTALFESYHAFSNIDSIRKSLNKYEIIETGSDIKIDYNTDFTTYHKLIEKVKTVYPNRESIKASTSWYIRIITSILFYIYIIHYMNLIHSIYIKCFLSIIASLIDTSIFLFNLSHDGSHYAISTNSIVNNTISKIANSWILWNHSMWFYHHVYYHHSFTGNKNDPDKNLYSINLMFDVTDKSPIERNSGDNLRPNFLSVCCNKCLSVETVVNIIYTSIPGQLFSQFIWYIYSSFKSRLWLIGIDHFKIPNTNHYDMGSLFIMFCKIYVLYNMGILPAICYIITGNTLYYLNVIADHDLYETHENYYDGNDWAKRQICNSGNFMNENKMWTMAFSGINHQIEHHLFPNVCGHKCAYIAPIVKEFCKENNLPYVHHSTMFGAYKSFMKKIKTC